MQIILISRSDPDFIALLREMAHGNSYQHFYFYVQWGFRRFASFVVWPRRFDDGNCIVVPGRFCADAIRA